MNQKYHNELIGLLNTLVSAVNDSGRISYPKQKALNESIRKLAIIGNDIGKNDSAPNQNQTKTKQQQFIEAQEHFYSAAVKLLDAWQETDVDDSFNEEYPFGTCFEEVIANIGHWINHTKKELANQDE